MNYILEIICPCSEPMSKSVEGVSKIRAKLLIIKGNQVYGVCRECSYEVALPLKIDIGMMNPPLILTE